MPGTTALALTLAVLSLAGAAAAAPSPAPEALETGDIVLIHSRSPQAAAIARATHSDATHTGVVVVEGGAPFVYEAAAHVKRTPFSSFAARAQQGSLHVRRYPGLDDAQRAKLAAAARADLGKPYDLTFSSGNDALYCSEYVRVVFAAAGLDVGKVEHIGDLDLQDAVVQALLHARWKKHPACRGKASLDACMPKLLAADIVTPGSIASDARLVAIEAAAAPPSRP